jgi:hypothetical protein
LSRIGVYRRTSSAGGFGALIVPTTLARRGHLNSAEDALTGVWEVIGDGGVWPLEGADEKRPSVDGDRAVHEPTRKTNMNPMVIRQPMLVALTR